MRCNNGIPADGMGAKTAAFSMACEKSDGVRVPQAPRKRHISRDLIQPKMPCQKPSGRVSSAVVMTR